MNAKIIATLCFLLSAFWLSAAESEWTPTLPYTLAHPSAWDALPDCRATEYRLLYLLEADKDAKQLRDRSKLSSNSSMSLGSVIDNLDEVLVTCYADTIACFKRKPNPRFLTMLLFHHRAYVNSAMERWQPVIEALRKLDPAITKRADMLAAPKRPRLQNEP